jgi:hypothetical protein
MIQGYRAMNAIMKTKTNLKKKKLKIKTLDTNYIDPSEILLHAAFQVLINFVDQSSVEDCWESKLESEISRLYYWWVHERPIRHNPIEPEIDTSRLIFDAEYASTHIKEQKEWEEWCDKKYATNFFLEDQENLEALIAIREYLGV